LIDIDYCSHVTTTGACVQIASELEPEWGDIMTSTQRSLAEQVIAHIFFSYSLSLSLSCRPDRLAVALSAAPFLMVPPCVLQIIADVASEREYVKDILAALEQGCIPAAGADALAALGACDKPDRMCARDER
jgi:hypothetical protein